MDVSALRFNPSSTDFKKKKTQEHTKIKEERYCVASVQQFF